MKGFCVWTGQVQSSISAHGTAGHILCRHAKIGDRDHIYALLIKSIKWFYHSTLVLPCLCERVLNFLLVLSV